MIEDEDLAVDQIQRLQNFVNGTHGNLLEIQVLTDRGGDSVESRELAIPLLDLRLCLLHGGHLFLQFGLAFHQHRVDLLQHLVAFLLLFGVFPDLMVELDFLHGNAHLIADGDEQAHFVRSKRAGYMAGHGDDTDHPILGLHGHPGEGAESLLLHHQPGPHLTFHQVFDQQRLPGDSYLPIQTFTHSHPGHTLREALGHPPMDLQQQLWLFLLRFYQIHPTGFNAHDGRQFADNVAEDLIQVKGLADRFGHGVNGPQFPVLALHLIFNFDLQRSFRQMFQVACLIYWPDIRFPTLCDLFDLSRPFL